MVNLEQEVAFNGMVIEVALQTRRFQQLLLQNVNRCTRHLKYDTNTLRRSSAKRHANKIHDDLLDFSNSGPLDCLARHVSHGVLHAIREALQTFR
jgi:hypothetical protein